MNIVALIPARSGSVRIKNKNVRPLAGHPLLAYTIAAARESGIFDAVFVSTDSTEYAAIATKYGAIDIQRPPEYAGDDSPDFEWVNHAMAYFQNDAFALLRPTSPFRSADTIRRAWEALQADESADSLRAVEPVKQHPAKMWMRTGNRIVPFQDWRGLTHKGQPLHSSPSQYLPQVFVQNASLEMAWTKTLKRGNISGERIIGWTMPGYEGFDLNDERDWREAEWAIASGQAVLPTIESKLEIQEYPGTPTLYDPPSSRKVTTRRK